MNNKNTNATNQFAAIGLVVMASLVLVIVFVIAILILQPDPDKKKDVKLTGPTPVKPVGQKGKTTDANCWSTQGTHVANQVSLSLANAYEAQEPLYWMDIRVNNKCKRTLGLNVSIKPREDAEGPIVEYDEDIADGLFQASLTAGKDFARKIDANFKFLRKNADSYFTLPIIWKIEDKLTGDILGENTNIIKVYPREVVVWGLKVSEHEKIPQELLFASLAAWVKKPPPSVQKKARLLASNLNTRLDHAEYIQAWFNLLYQHLFHNQNGDSFYVHSIPKEWQSFPPSNEQHIHTAAHLLNNPPGRLDALEALLLIGAMTESVENLSESVDLGLFVLHNQATDKIEVLFSWSPSPREWLAINMTQVNTQSFTDNVTQATSTLDQALSEARTISEELYSSKGFSISETGSILLAMNFKKTASKHHIRGLP